MNMLTLSYDEIWQRAKRLPVNAQMELAEALLHNVRTTFIQELEPSDVPDLAPINGLSKNELHVLAEAIVSPERQQTLNLLLEKSRDQTLSEEEAGELDKLLDEIDQVALLKARALYTLQLGNSAN